jgi:hypothetical protein
MSGVEEKDETRQNDVVILPASIQTPADISTKLWSVLLEEGFFDDVSLDGFLSKVSKYTVYMSNGKLLESPEIYSAPGKNKPVSS